MTISADISRTGATELPSACRGEILAEIPLLYGGVATLPISYELVGSPRDPLLLVAGGISADSHVVANSSDGADGWWQSQSASFARNRVLAIDWFGADGRTDHPIDPSDQARAILAVLDALGEDRAAGFLGASYGGMVGMHVSAIAPHRLGALLCIGAVNSAHPFSSALRALQRQVIELGERSGWPEEGVAVARKLAVLTYRTPDEFGRRFERSIEISANRATAKAETYLDHLGLKHSRRMSSVAYRRLSESIDLHWIDPSQIRVPATFVAVDSDQLVPACDIETLARETPSGRFIRISSLYGHDAFLKERQAVASIIADFLKSLEQQQ